MHATYVLDEVFFVAGAGGPGMGSRAHFGEAMKKQMEDEEASGDALLARIAEMERTSSYSLT